MRVVVVGCVLYVVRVVCGVLCVVYCVLCVVWCVVCICGVCCVLCVATYYAFTYPLATLFSSSLLQQYLDPMLAATRVSSASHVLQLAYVKCARSDGENGGGSGNVYLDGGTGNVYLDPPSQAVVQQADAGITQAPFAWAMLEETDDPEPVEWLLDSYLSGERASLKLLVTGDAVPLEQDEAFPPIIRLETFIKVTKQRRSNYVNHPYDILSEDTLTELLNDWEDDHTAWMNRSAQRTFYGLKVSQRREWTKNQFRNFIFKMCSNDDLVRFWLRVPASGMSLRIFKEVFVDGEQETSKNIKMNRAVQAVRYALRNADR